MSASAAAKPAGRTMAWWLVLIEGLAAVFIGLMLFKEPVTTANIIVWSIGLFWLVSGIISIIRIFTDRSHWGWKLFSGVIGIIAGWFLITNIGDGATLAFGVAVVLVLALQGIIMGIAGLIEAFRGGGWGPGIMGGLAIVIGFLLLGNMWAATLVLPWVIGIFAIVGGILAIVMAFELRRA